MDHSTILQILERRATRFRSGRSAALEKETDTGEMDAILRRERELEAMVVEERELKDTQDEVLEIHGTRPGKKPEGVVRLLYKNANRIDG